MVKKKDGRVPWQHSDAKETLRKDILEGTLVTPSMKPREVLATRPELYEPYKKTFGSNLSNLRKDIKANQDRALEDSAALEHDRRIHPRPTHTAGGYPRWDGSDAERLLKEDVGAVIQGLVAKLAPSELYASRPEYQVFPLPVFRNHIYQEERARRDSSYWLAKKADKKNSYKS